MSALIDPAVLQRYGLNPKDERYTRPPTKEWCLEKLQLERYTLDVAGCPAAHLAPRWFGVQLDGSFIDGLERPWSGDVWANIPFSQWTLWLPKAWHEWGRGRCRSISMLLPNDKTEQEAWQAWVADRRDRRGSPLRAFELPGRPRFASHKTAGVPLSRKNGGSGPGSPFFGCYLLGWHEHFRRGAPFPTRSPPRCT